MNRKLKIAQYGCGKMSLYTMRYVYEKGAEVVAAFDVNPNIIGKDIGDILNSDKKGVVIENAQNAEEILTKIKPDCVIITTMSLMKDLEDILMICAKNGINAITTCEEAIYPWNSAITITKKIDEEAKKNKCTICGSGYQDVFWGNLVTTLAGATHNINKIKGKSSYNVEDYGIALAKAHGAGLSLDEFEKEIAATDNISEEERFEIINKGEFMPSYMWSMNGWIVSQLGLTVKKQIQKCIPQTYNKDLNSTTLNMNIKEGYATGMSALVVTETEEGIIIESECIGKVYSEEDIDSNEWTIYGEPDTKMVIKNPCTVELTCATIVNRIPDVINAPYGFTTTEKMPRAIYRSKPLNEYVK